MNTVLNTLIPLEEKTSFNNYSSPRLLGTGKIRVPIHQKIISVNVKMNEIGFVCLTILHVAKDNGRDGCYC